MAQQTNSNAAQYPECLERLEIGWHNPLQQNWADPDDYEE